jgi:YVTN family beta-propeller protein
MRLRLCDPVWVVAVLLCEGCSHTAAVSNREPADDSSLPGMPPILDAANIYSETAAGKLADAVRSFPERVYVPNSGSDSVDVIDPKTFKVIDHFRVERQPQHVTPSWDLKTLWVLNDLGDSLTRLDPATGEKRETLPVKDP